MAILYVLTEYKKPKAINSVNLEPDCSALQRSD